ncbi:MAG: hypothetical protein HOE90_02360 [Bacteriovoracaceae bacterium]|jgi:hypothetical protein|nr:hypothetical protein [Bacteriovoracaceae bacterium]
MNKAFTFKNCGWLIAVLLFSSLSASFSYAGSARSSSITHWNGECSGGTRTWWDDMCMAWRKRMGSKGWSQWWVNYHLVRVGRYVDPTIAAWGQDKWNLDGGDAALMCTHGGYDENGWYGVMHTKDHGQCRLNVSDMKIGPYLGNGKNRFWHMSSCNSIRWNLLGKWWGPAAGRVHVITGFHGYMYIGSKYVGEYRDLAKYGFSSKGVGKVWRDKMHHVHHWYNSWKTVCPISLGFGYSRATSANALNEKYKWAYSNKNPNWMTYTWKSGCDPTGGPKLPN